MKPQDLLFIIVLVLLLFLRKPRILVGTGLICLFLAVPLFAKWIFFTAERLVYYAALFFIAAIILFIINEFKREK